MDKVLGVIPARYQSTRFPGKPLVDIGGKTMIQRVYEQASQSQNLDKVIVATDDERIYAHVQSFQGQVMMTSNQHLTGTDRCAEVARAFAQEYPIIINIQGDEPFINPKQIDELAQLFEDPKVEIGTLAKKIESHAELISENEAKVLINQKQEVIYMSRSPVPFFRNVPVEEWIRQRDYFKHIGIYGFRTHIILKIPELPPSELEKTESLEQLRWLDHYQIKIGITQYDSVSVDTPEDLQRLQKFL